MKKRRNAEDIEAISAKAREVLSESPAPMTVRQVYYQLVAVHAIENTRSEYQLVSKLLVKARLEGLIFWAQMEDRLRKPRAVSMWDDLEDFGEAVLRSYRRDVWKAQPKLVECWLEKDALSGIFESLLWNYGVTLNVGRGFDGWDSIHNAALRYAPWADGEDVTVLYFGDFDPSGEEMVSSLRKRLATLESFPTIVKCALTREDIDRYRLPPEPAKRSDSRSSRFIAQHGDLSVELDALPVRVLQARIIQEVEARIDLEELQATRDIEDGEREELRESIKRLGEG